LRTLLAATLSITAVLQVACQRIGSAYANPGATSNEPGNPSSVHAIELTAAQLRAVTIEPAQTRDFAVESETVGSITFDEDPSVVQAESTLLTAAGNLEMSQRELVRVQSLGEANGIAPKELEAALAARQAAAANLKASRDAVRAVGVPEEQLARMLRTGRFDPADAKAHRKWVAANLPESDSPRVRAGQAVRVQVPAIPGHWYLGTVSRIYATIDPGTHRITVRALIEDPNNELRPGMLATVVIRFAVPVPAVAIPTTAAVREGDGSMIAWVTADRHHFSMRQLQLGLQSQGHYQVLDGLKPQELVVTEGGVFLSNLLEAPPSD
jgi:cobalt-zinc-cadmium efflux system membrane fusion protein